MDQPRPRAVRPGVRQVDIAGGLPFPSAYAAVCYSSHVLEHLDRPGARRLLAECFRILKSGGVIRVVVPDLEQLAREYLRALEAAASGGVARDLEYDWLMLEMYDQTVRNRPGGEMAPFLAALREEGRSFVRARIGTEAEKFWKPQPRGEAARVHLGAGRALRRMREALAGGLVWLVAGKAAYASYRAGLFRAGGEVHQWMYDRYSLARLLQQAGFVDVRVCAPGESRIPDFARYALDVANGQIRKPDSLYMEASRP